MQLGELAGQWWLPDTPDKAAPGRLQLTQDARPLLALSGAITGLDAERDVFRSLFGRERKIGHMYGRTTRGIEVTLSDCRLSVDEMEWDRPAGATYTIVSAAAYLGGHLDPESAGFHEMSLEVQRLVDWIGPPPIEVAVEPRLSRPERIRVDATLPTKVTIELEGGELEMAQSLDVSGDRRLRAGIARKASLRLRVERALTIAEWFEGYVGPLGRLVSLSAGVHLAPERVQFRSPDQDWIEVAWPHPINVELPDGPFAPADLLFGLGDLQSDPSRQFRAWLALSSDYKPVLDSFFATRSTMHMYEEDRFANLIQAAEGFHRRKIGARPPSTRSQVRRFEVIEAAPERHRKWLTSALKHADEYSLDQRISGLVKLQPWLIGDVIPERYQDWSLLAAKTRNARAHHDPAALPIGTWELLGLSQRLATLLEACLLAEIGFGQSEVRDMIQRASRPYRILKLNKL